MMNEIEGQHSRIPAFQRMRGTKHRQPGKICKFEKDIGIVLQGEDCNVKLKITTCRSIPQERGSTS
jgi:hypothetical protein